MNREVGGLKLTCHASHENVVANKKVNENFPTLRNPKHVRNQLQQFFLQLTPSLVHISFKISTEKITKM